MLTHQAMGRTTYWHHAAHIRGQSLHLETHVGASKTMTGEQLIKILKTFLYLHCCAKDNKGRLCMNRHEQKFVI